MRSEPSAATPRRPDATAARRGAVHAIVVNYRTPDLTAAAVARLRAGAPVDRDLVIYVVDNGSGDDSADRLRSTCPGTILIASPTNLGFAGGNNLALRDIVASVPAGTDHTDTFVLLLNSDVEVEQDTVSACLAFMDDHPCVAIVGPRLLLPDGSLDLACRRGFPTPARAFWKLTGLAKRFPDNSRFTGYNLTHLDELETTEVDSVVGAFMLVRLSAIDQTGLLDDTFFMYGEDLDWAYRMKARGWRVFYYPVATALHLKGATSRRQSYRMLYEFYRSMWLFHRKHYAQRNGRLLNWLVLAGIIARGGVAMAANALRPAHAKRVA